MLNEWQHHLPDALGSVHAPGGGGAGGSGNGGKRRIAIYSLNPPNITGSNPTAVLLGPYVKQTPCRESAAPTQSATPTATATETQTSSVTLTASETPTASDTPVTTETATDTPVATDTASLTPSETFTLGPTLTPSETPTATETQTGGLVDPSFGLAWVGKLNSDLSSAVFRLPNLSTGYEPLPSRLLDTEEVTRTIQYSYDGLHRLISAEYDDGNFFNYTYDSVGNRLSETTQLANTIYSYDAANRLTSVNGVPYSWDANGNMVSDGVATFTYDHANRLIAWTHGNDSYAFAYNGLGDRLQQTTGGVTTNYTLDLNAGLTQVIADGMNNYLYGLGRIGQSSQPLLLDEWAYHLPDALGSVRQLADAAGTVNYAQSFEPYGDLLTTGGSQMTSYGFAGEWSDATGLQYLRARYYNPSTGAFFQVDPFEGLDNDPRTFNPYQYAFNNPLLYKDPTGRFPLIIAAGVLPFVIGALGGGVIGSLTYDWALAGDCDCDMQQWAIQTNRTSYLQNMALSGGVLATIGTLAAVAGGPVAIAVGGLFVSASVTDILRLDWNKWAQGGWTRCDILRFSVDALGVLGGIGLIKWGVQTIRPLPLPNHVTIEDLPNLGVKGSSEYIREIHGTTIQDALRVFNQLSRGYVKEVLDPNGVIIRTMPDGSRIIFRPKTSAAGVVGVDIHDDLFLGVKEFKLKFKP